MHSQPITVVGTPQGFWTQWVSQMLSRLEHAQVHADLPTSDALDTVLGERPEARALVLVEHPAIGLARVLADGGGVDPKAWLDEWLASGRALLAHAQRHPLECVLVNADDARRQPGKLAQLLRSCWGESLVPPVDAVPAARLDPLAEALAWSFVDRDLAVQGVAEELLASCIVLPGEEPLSSALVPRGASRGADATRRLAELVQAERRVEQDVRALAAERDAQADRVRGTERDLADARARLGAAELERATLLARLDDAQARHALAAKDLSIATRGLDAAKQELADTRVRLDGLQARLEDATGELAAARSRADELAARLDEQRAATSQSDAQRARLDEQLRTARGEADLLLKQLHQVQEELERTFLARREAEAALAAATAGRDAAEARAQDADRQRVQLEARLATAESRAKAADAAAAATTARIEQATTDRTRLERELAAAAARAESAAKQLAEERARTGGHAKDLEAVRGQLAQAGTQRTKLEQELRAAKDEGELLLQQLHQVQEELERMFLDKRDAENALLAAKAASGATELERQLKDVRDENELYALQMKQVQGELERVHAEKVRLAAAAKGRIGLPGIDDVVIGDVAMTGERDAHPHREVSFVVRDVQAGERRVAEATVRLVEHWGRPGLAIFRAEDAPALLDAWRESGREDGRPYLLLVHGDDAAQRVFDAMGTLDWQLMQALALRLQQALHASPTWRPLAQRLVASLDGQPARLRHEGVRVMPIAQESPGVARWALALERASYRGTTWPRLTIQWRAHGARPSIELLRDEAGGPPLLAWPADEDGVPVRVLRLPMAEDANAPDVRAAWDGLGAADRAFVAEILNQLPLLAVHVQASAGAGVSGADLQAAARTTVMLGRAALQPPAPPVRGGVLRRVARRLRAAARPAAPAANAAPVRR